MLIVVSDGPVRSIFEIFAQVNGADLFVVDQIVGLAGGEDGAVADDVGSVADAEGFAYVVVGNEYADAARFEEDRKSVV